ncbi:hypothetical protein SA58113_0066 [Staphylococcus argenteus]|nr:hypothetical protein SA58113_0066 [Staphylococcus argenteus]
MHHFVKQVIANLPFHTENLHNKWRYFTSHIQITYIVK